MRSTGWLVQAVCGIAAAAIVGAQAPSAERFDVASIKPNTTSATGWSITYPGDSWRATNSTLAALISSAYGIRPERLAGGPAWVQTSRFDVHARAGRPFPREQMRAMAQRLLEDRFGLVLKKEQREQEVYALRLARAGGRIGADMRRAADGCEDAPAPATSTPSSSTGARPTTWGWCATTASLATLLSRHLAAEVVNQTGLEGRWDFVLAFAPLAPAETPAAGTGQSSVPSIFVAVEEQLGLKLERNARGLVEYVVIAAARPPGEN